MALVASSPHGTTERCQVVCTHLPLTIDEELGVPATPLTSALSTSALTPSLHRWLASIGETEQRHDEAAGPRGCQSCCSQLSGKTAVRTPERSCLAMRAVGCPEVSEEIRSPLQVGPGRGERRRK